MAVKKPGLASQHQQQQWHLQLPPPSDERGWREFCYGKSAGSGDWQADKGEVEGESDSSSGSEEKAQEGNGESNSSSGHQPLVSLVQRLPRATVLALLRYHARWLDSRSLVFTDSCGQWLFALLAVLEKPLLAEEEDRLRRLAQACRRARSGLAAGLQDPAAVPLCLVLCLVARCFGQADLADP